MTKGAEAVKKTLEKLKKRDPDQDEFHQAVEEVLQSVVPLLDKKPELCDLLDQIVEPERVLIFRVCWVNDKGETQVNRGYRIQYSSALGPYKGGTRFHPKVTLSTLKFLGFEQTFKNALTGLPLGSGKGGADFDPRDKSTGEKMRFCQAYMSELYRHIGDETDVPAGDAGVGAKEIGFMFGMYKKLTGRFNGTLTGKDPSSGGSLCRSEATGYGLVYFVKEILKSVKKEISGMVVGITGSGNVAQHTAAKCVELGAKVVTMSDSDGWIYDEEGLNEEKLQFIFELKNDKHGRISEVAKKFKSVKYTATKENAKSNPLWETKMDIALPCATQNELTETDANNLVKNNVILVCEGANMPCTHDAVAVFRKNKTLYCPGKASNAGGVAVSGLEMAQNAQHLFWKGKDVDDKLQEIMKEIYQRATETALEYDKSGDILTGANIYAFEKVAKAMIAQGVV